MLDLATMINAERARATVPLEEWPGPLAGEVVARILVRGEPQSWQRPLVVRAQVSEVESRRLVDALLASTDPPSVTVAIWREEHNRLVRTITPAETLDAEETARAFLRTDMEARGVTLASLAGIALGLRCRFHLGNRLRPDLDNLVAIVMEAMTGTCAADDRQVVEVQACKCLHSEDPRTEAIVYRAGVYR